MWIIYIIVIIGVLYGIAAILKHNMDIKKDEQIRELISKSFKSLPKEKKYKMLMESYQSLKNSLPLLQSTAKTIDQLAEVDRIKRNIRILLEECKKLEHEIATK